MLQKSFPYGCSVKETDEFYFKHVFENVKNKSFKIYDYGKNDKFDIMNRIHLLSGGMHKFRSHNLISFTDSSKYSVPNE